MHAWDVCGVTLQENPSNVSRGTAEKVLCSPSKIPSNVDPLQRNYAVCKECMESDRGEVKKNPFYGK